MRFLFFCFCAASIGFIAGTEAERKRQCKGTYSLDYGICKGVKDETRKNSFVTWHR